eukprot:SAG11_NODE_2842_length_2915_cov_9.258523_1_plen_72_part_10
MSRDDSEKFHEAYMSEMNSLDAKKVISHNHTLAELRAAGITSSPICLNVIYEIKNSGRYKVREVLRGDMCVK